MITSFDCPSVYAFFDLSSLSYEIYPAQMFQAAFPWWYFGSLFDIRQCRFERSVDQAASSLHPVCVPQLWSRRSSWGDSWGQAIDLPYDKWLLPGAADEFQSSYWGKFGPAACSVDYIPHFCQFGEDSFQANAQLQSDWYRAPEFHSTIWPVAKSVHLEQCEPNSTQSNNAFVTGEGDLVSDFQSIWLTSPTAPLGSLFHGSTNGVDSSLLDSDEQINSFLLHERHEEADIEYGTFVNWMEGRPRADSTSVQYMWMGLRTYWAALYAYQQFQC